MLPNFKKILFATDLESNAGGVFRYAMSLAIKYEAEIYVVHALTPLCDTAKSAIESLFPEDKIEEIHANAVARVRETGKKRLEDFCAQELSGDTETRNRVVELIIDDGKPSDVILHEATRLDVDLIVLGSTPHTTIGEILLGSTAHSVMQRSRRPVLLARTEKH